MTAPTTQTNHHFQIQQIPLTYDNRALLTDTEAHFNVWYQIGNTFRNQHFKAAENSECDILLQRKIGDSLTVISLLRNDCYNACTYKISEISKQRNILFLTKDRTELIQAAALAHFKKGGSFSEDEIEITRLATAPWNLFSKNSHGNLPAAVSGAGSFALGHAIVHFTKLHPNTSVTLDASPTSVSFYKHIGFSPQHINNADYSPHNQMHIPAGKVASITSRLLKKI